MIVSETISGGAPVMQNYQIGGVANVAGEALYAAATAGPGLLTQGTPGTAIADMVGMALDVGTPSTTQGSAESLVRVVINGDQTGGGAHAARPCDAPASRRRLFGARGHHSDRAGDQRIAGPRCGQVSASDEPGHPLQTRRATGRSADPQRWRTPPQRLPALGVRLRGAGVQ